MRVGVANLSTSVTTKRVEKEAEPAADWFPIHFPTATVTLSELEDGTASRLPVPSSKGRPHEPAQD